MFTKVEMMNHTIFWGTLLFQLILPAFWKHCVSKTILSQGKPQILSTLSWLLILDPHTGVSTAQKVQSAAWRAKVKTRIQVRKVTFKISYLQELHLAFLFMLFYIFLHVPEMSSFLGALGRKNNKPILTDVIADKLEIVFRTEIFVCECR